MDYLLFKVLRTISLPSKSALTLSIISRFGFFFFMPFGFVPFLKYIKSLNKSL